MIDLSCFISESNCIVVLSMWTRFIKLTGLLKPATSMTPPTILRNFSLLSSNATGHNVAPNACNQRTFNLLQPSSLALYFERGMKQVGNVKRRCKDCYLVVRQERLYNMCKAHPRHKQMAMKKKDKNTWIKTDATQSPLRAW